MSHDVYAMRVPPGTGGPHDLPADHVPAPAGRQEDVVRVLREVATEAGAAWDSYPDVHAGPGAVRCAFGGVEVTVAPEQVVLGFTTRGAPEDVLAVLEVCRRLGLAAFDGGEGFLDDAGALEGAQRWRSYRDRAAGTPRGTPPAAEPYTGRTGVDPAITGEPPEEQGGPGRPQ